MEKIVYIDMDGVIADFEVGKRNHPLVGNMRYIGKPDTLPGLYADLPPIEGAIEAVNALLDAPQFDIYFLSTAPWDNPEAWMHKRLWIEKHFETKKIRKRLILAHQKQLLIGDYLIDDRMHNGANQFTGEWIQFGSNNFPNWLTVNTYLLEKERQT